MGAGLGGHDRKAAGSRPCGGAGEAFCAKQYGTFARLLKVARLEVIFPDCLDERFLSTPCIDLVIIFPRKTRAFLDLCHCDGEVRGAVIPEFTQGRPLASTTADCAPQLIGVSQSRSVLAAVGPALPQTHT